MNKMPISVTLCNQIGRSFRHKKLHGARARQEQHAADTSAVLQTDRLDNLPPPHAHIALAGIHLYTHLVAVQLCALLLQQAAREATQRVLCFAQQIARADVRVHKQPARQARHHALQSQVR